MTKNQIDYMNASENIRHNRAVENETQRNNIAVLGETNRHNVAYEGETQRHNIATEQNQMQTNVINQAHYERMDAEQYRHNAAVEQETYRSNLASESIRRETNRVGLISANAAMQQAAAATKNAETQAWDAKNKVVSYESQYMNALNQNSLVESQVKLNNANASYVQTQDVLAPFNAAVNAVGSIAKGAALFAY